ncbi:MAG: DUF5677 domain-containing protein [Candidatus Cybelea sp.]
MNGLGFPLLPEITDALLEQCSSSDDYRPILFELYKHVGLLSIAFAQISPESQGLRALPPLEFSILIGLLTRCSRLMLSTLRLTSEGRHGETTALIDRCIFESSVILRWLCCTELSDRFERYVGHGLKSELALKALIEETIRTRGGVPWAIEKRMIESIARYVDASGFDEKQVAQSKRLPDLASMIRAIGRDPIDYVVGQRLASHAVHGTWPDLFTHYLEQADGRLVPCDNASSSMTANEFMSISLHVLNALDAFCEYVVLQPDARIELATRITSARSQLLSIYDLIAKGDFDPEPTF